MPARVLRRVAFTIPVEECDRLEQIADRRGTTVTSLLTMIVRSLANDELTTLASQLAADTEPHR